MHSTHDLPRFPFAVFLVLLAAWCVITPGRGDERADDAVEVEAAESGDGTPQEQEQDESAGEDHGKDAKEAKPKGPPPTGKLNIRKGTGRPKGAPAVVRDVEVQAAVAAPDVAAGLQRMGVEERTKEMQHEMIQKLRPVLHEEVYFVHLVCDTTRAERRELLAAAEPELEKAASAAARQSLVAGMPQGARAIQVRQGNRVVMRRDGRSTKGEVEPVTMLRESLLQLAAEHLGDQRASRLREEMKLRVESQRRDTIANMIAHLDFLLVLDREQEEELDKLLISAWREEWRSIPQQLPRHYFPAMQLPKEVQSIFTIGQRKRWSSVRKIRIGNQRNALAMEANPAAEADRWKKALDNLDHDEAGDDRSD